MKKCPFCVCNILVSLEITIKSRSGGNRIWPREDRFPKVSRRFYLSDTDGDVS